MHKIIIVAIACGTALLTFFSNDSTKLQSGVSQQSDEKTVMGKSNDPESTGVPGRPEPTIEISSNQVAKSDSHTENSANIPVKLISDIKKSPPSVKNSAWLCENLHKLKKIPYEDGEIADDPIFDGLITEGKRALPCLIGKITDTRIIADPREGDPQILDFRVGDAAVFMLMNITNEDEHPEKMLPPDYAKYWKENGIYSYFYYVEKSANRKQLQLWWKNWMKKNS